MSLFNNITLEEVQNFQRETEVLIAISVKAGRCKKLVWLPFFDTYVVKHPDRGDFTHKYLKNAVEDYNSI